MDILSIILVAIALSMDAFFVALTNGCTVENMPHRDAFRIAFFFGLFQAVMPILGWLGGTKLYDIIYSFSHIIAFALLFIVGMKMIIESFQAEKCDKDENCMSMKTLLLLSIATSIDAFAIGFSFSLIDIHIIFPAFIIGIITFVISLSGVYIGKRVYSLAKNKRILTIIGGSILIIIGMRILLERYLLG